MNLRKSLVISGFAITLFIRPALNFQNGQRYSYCWFKLVMFWPVTVLGKIVIFYLLFCLSICCTVFLFVSVFLSFYLSSCLSVVFPSTHLYFSKSCRQGFVKPTFKVFFFLKAKQQAHTTQCN